MFLKLNHWFRLKYDTSEEYFCTVWSSANKFMLACTNVQMLYFTDVFLAWAEEIQEETILCISLSEDNIVYWLKIRLLCF